MPASRYDIYAEQGTTFKLYMDYKYAGSTGINLNGFSGAMQIRRSAKEDNVLLYLTTTGVTGCGSTGYFNSSNWSDFVSSAGLVEATG